MTCKKQKNIKEFTKVLKPRDFVKEAESVGKLPKDAFQIKKIKKKLKY